jgi:hypothetical protein
MVEEGSKGSYGWRLIAVGSLLVLAMALGVMSFALLPEIPPARFTGVVRVALATAEGIRDNVIVVAAAFVVLGGIVGLGYADKLAKTITILAGLTLLFFIIATWWTLKTVPVAGLIEIR